MFRSLFIQASKKVGIFFSGAARRLEANDYLTKAIQIRELFWDYSKGLVIIIVPAGFSTEGCHRTDAYRVSNINMSRNSPIRELHLSLRSIPDSLFKSLIKSLIQYPTLEILHKN